MCTCDMNRSARAILLTYSCPTNQSKTLPAPYANIRGYIDIHKESKCFIYNNENFHESGNMNTEMYANFH